MNKMISIDRGLRQPIPLLFLIAAFGLIFSGCAGRRPPAPHALYDSPEAALRALAASATAETVTATARIEINNHGERYPLRVGVMMKRPASLRVESIPVLGPPDFFLSVAEDGLRVFVPGKDAFYTGRAAPQNISRFFPVFMPAAEMVSLLMGAPPEPTETLSGCYGEQEEGAYRVDQYKSGRRMRSLWIDPSGGLLIRIRAFKEDGETIFYTAGFAEHTPVGGGFMPQRLTITGDDMPGLSLHYTDLRQITTDQASFPLPVPEGITPILLDP